MERKKPFRLLALLAVFTAFMLAVMPTPAWADTEVYNDQGFKVSVHGEAGADIDGAVTVTVKLNDEVVAVETINGELSWTGNRVNVVTPADYGAYISDTSGISSYSYVAGYFRFYTNGDCSLTVNLFKTHFSAEETGIGDISVEPATSEGYNLTARIYVNGELAFTTPQMRVVGGAPNGFSLDVAEGLFYHDLRKQVPYDFHSASGAASWMTETGTLNFDATQDRDHNNVLDIFLTTFEDYAYLDVNRGAGVDISDNMVGYRVSYSLDGKDYSYLVTSFATEDSQIIPKGVPVTIEAVCKAGWEVTEWSIASSINNDFESLGNSAVLTTNVANGESIVVTATHVCPMPEKPTFEEVEDIFDDKLVTVDCVNTTIDPEHEDKTYRPIAGGVEIGDVVNNNGTYNVTLTVTAPTYVGKYSSDVQVAHMLADDATDTYEVVLTYKDGKWYKADGFSPVVFEVMCSEVQDPKPELPTQEELAQLTGAQVKVTCVTENSGHGSEEYAPIAGAYSFPKGVEGDAEQGYTATMDVNAAAYVDEFSTDDRGEHDLAAGEADTKSVVLAYVASSDGQGSWQLADDAAQINFNVKCVVEPEPEPEGPDTPGKDVLDELFGDQFVTVDCVNNNAGHDDKSYGLVDGAYTVHHEKDATTATVVVSPHVYVNKYENEPDINKAHELKADSPESTTFKLKHENGVWAIDGPSTVTYRVVCADDAPVVPDQPTYDEILEATPQGAVTIDCTNAEVEHENKTYDIEKGAYTLGAVNDADGDSIYTVDVQVSAGTYVLKFENDHEGIHHYLDPADQGAKTITLAYSEATDSWSVADDSASPVTFTVLCDVEGTTDPGTDPDEPGTDPDEPGDEGDEPGTNPDDKPGDDGQGDKPGDQGGNGDQNKGDGANNGSGNGKLSQTGDVAALVAAVVAGAGALTAGAGYVAKRRK